MRFLALFAITSGACFGSTITGLAVLNYTPGSVSGTMNPFTEACITIQPQSDCPSSAVGTATSSLTSGARSGSASAQSSLSPSGTISDTAQLGLDGPPFAPSLPPAPRFAVDSQADSSLLFNSPLSSLSFFPSISLASSGGNTNVNADAVVGVFDNEITDPLGYLRFHRLSLSVSFQNTGSFGMDPVNSTVTLNVSPGASGSIQVLFFNNAYITLLSYSFVTDPVSGNLVVTDSSNSLGWALPGVGENPNFSLSIAAISAALPVPEDPSDGTTFDFSEAAVGGAIVGVTIPEPGTLGLSTLGLLGAYARLAARRRRPASR
ncbi:MAG TPA: PEP-CTERM sorting domain-containing protein [Bryobacteraceae bacterium]|jgi:hypothetical protein